MGRHLDFVGERFFVELLVVVHLETVSLCLVKLLLEMRIVRDLLGGIVDSHSFHTKRRGSLLFLGSISSRVVEVVEQKVHVLI
jgi:hypothetical protein